MPEDYAVQPGDCLSSIGAERGFSWKTLWNHPQNASLKKERRNPNVLFPGDIVHIPDLRTDTEPCATDQTHKFEIKGVPAKIRIVLTDDEDEPLPNQPYKFEVEDQVFRGNTDGNGALEHGIPAGARKARLTVDYQNQRIQYQVRIGAVDPVEKISGAQGRLLDFGYFDAEITGVTDEATVSALLLFQARHDLPCTGENDAQTQTRLKELFGC